MEYTSDDTENVALMGRDCGVPANDTHPEIGRYPFDTGMVM